MKNTSALSICRKHKTNYEEQRTHRPTFRRNTLHGPVHLNHIHIHGYKTHFTLLIYIVVHVSICLKFCRRFIFSTRSLKVPTRTTFKTTSIFVL